MRMIAAVVLTAVITIVLPTAVCAQQPDERRQCFASEGVAPEQKLESCTLLIETGGQTSQTRVAAFNSRGNVHLTQRNYDRAIDDYNAAIRLDPTYAIGFNNRGLAYQGKRQIDRAIEDYDEAIHLNPISAVAFDNRATARQITGQERQSDRDNRCLAAASRADAYRNQAQWEFAQWEFAPIWPTGL
jgi:tetratricopeptide (TPR) repeat protein